MYHRGSSHLIKECCATGEAIALLGTVFGDTLLWVLKTWSATGIPRSFDFSRTICHMVLIFMLNG